MNKIMNKLEIAVLSLAEEINKRQISSKWELMGEQDLWYELAACILGSNIKFECAQAYAYYLKSIGSFDINKAKQSFTRYELKIFRALSSPTSHENGLKWNKYRYPKLKASQLRKTAQLLYGKGNSIRNKLLYCSDPLLARAEIISDTVGIGPKQSSLFLRNVGYSDEVAILDRHILKYLSLLKIGCCDTNKLSSLSYYEKIEKELIAYADQFNAKLSVLDTAIWVVMRVKEKGLYQ
jgi:N-glycosylase/DNA lyase